MTSILNDGTVMLRGGASANQIPCGGQRPVKYVSNPVFGNAAWTWDEDINYAWVLTDAAWPDASKYRMFYNGYGTATNEWVTCYAYSADGLTWTKPNVGHITYGGNTNNNILIDLEEKAAPCYDSGGSPGQQYLLISSVVVSGSFVWKIYGSDDDTPTGNYILLKTITTSVDKDPQFLIRKPDGKYFVYYQTGYAADARQIGLYISNTTDPAGTWTDEGVSVWYGNSASDQRYSVSVNSVGDFWYAQIVRYNKTTERLDKIFLYRSSDAVNWDLFDTDWLSIGAATTWDDEMITCGMPIRVADEWWIYYCGYAENHAHAIPRSARVGLAKIGVNNLANA